MPGPPESEDVAIDGPAGRLEALYECPQEAAPRASVVVCHPHPQYGGTLRNKVVHTLARAFVRQDCAALRFNFRGVGKSEGAWDEGQGEQADAEAAVEWLRRRLPGIPLWLAGFSFGAAIAIRVAASAEPAGLVTVAPAVRRFAAGLESQPDCPWLVVQGDADELVDVAETIDWVNGLAPGPELVVMPGVDHFFHGRLVELRATVSAFLGDYLPPPR